MSPTDNPQVEVVESPTKEDSRPVIKVAEIAFHDVVVPAEMEFFNVENPGDTIFISQDPEYDKLSNKALAKDKYATFQAGLFSTSDPDVIKTLNSQAMRDKGVRCMANPEDMAEYGSSADRKTYMEQEIKRQVEARLEEERATQVHATVSPFETSKAEVVESVEPPKE